MKSDLSVCHFHWHILDVGSIWMREFAAALAQDHAVTAWWPEMRRFGGLETWEREELVADPSLKVVRFPLQRGYSRAPIRTILPFERRLAQQVTARMGQSAATPLICSTPFYAPLAELWQGPVVYYVTDLTAGYEGLRYKQVLALDRRMCAVATAVCPNSQRIRHYLIHEAGCHPEKITVVPNATRASNVPVAPLLQPQALPAATACLPRPLAGVIGNLSANMDWLLLEKTIQSTPWLHWVMVGPTGPIAEAAQEAARSRVIHSERITLTGPKPYGELQCYARAFDVAILPYRKREPTYSGSSTRFYEHLSACRPMVASRGFAELLEKPPLLELVDTPEEMTAALERMRSVNFCDGQETARWQASQKGTWTERARTLVRALEERLT